MDFFEKAVFELQKERPIFHSEDDLKLALALKIKEQNPKFKIRLERPIELEMIIRSGGTKIVRAPIDIIVTDENGGNYPIELKYKTKKACIFFNEEKYILAEHGATDTGRFSFRKDIFRIENFKSKNLNYKCGYVFILTNDKSYFEKNVLEKDNLDKHFSFHNGMLLNRFDLSWHYNKLDKTKFILKENNILYHINSKMHWTCTPQYFFKLDLLKDYQITWKDFSKFEKTNFKYCLIKIEV